MGRLVVVGGVMTSSMNEIQRRINRAIEGYSCAYMNNTKWREVLDLLGSLRMPIQFAFVRDENFMIQTIFPEGGCDDDHTLDCTTHGPFNLKEIYAIKCPKYQDKMNPQTGVKYRCEKRFKTVVEGIRSLGEIPIELNDNNFVIYGYKKS